MINASSVASQGVRTASSLLGREWDSLEGRGDRAQRASQVVVVNGAEFDPSNNELRYRGQVRRFTRTQGALLGHLIRLRRTGVVPRERLHYAMYGDRLDGGPELKILDVLVCKLRPVLRDMRLPFSIATVWGLGYSIVECEMEAVTAQEITLSPMQFAALNKVLEIAERVPGGREHVKLVRTARPWAPQFATA